MVEARSLQTSAIRRIWSTLLDHRDWISYVYVPLLVPILVGMPYVIYKTYQHSQRFNQLLSSLAQGGPELATMMQLLENGPEQPWTGIEAEEVTKLEPPDFTGYEILQDSAIMDLRTWRQGQKSVPSWITVTRHMRVHKLREHAGTNPFAYHLLTTNPKVEVLFPPQDLPGKLRVSHDRSRKQSTWEASFDFSKAPSGDMQDVSYKYLLYGAFQDRSDEMLSLHFHAQAHTAELMMWILMPEGKEYRQYQLIRYPIEKPEKVEPFKVATEYLADDYSILAFKLLSVGPEYNYELHWRYKQ
jgi:hypothetical protein